MKRLVACLLALTSSAAAAEISRGLTENVVSRASAEQTYTLFLPTSYDPAKKAPLLLILDPRGRGTVAANIFKDAAEERGWILVSSNQSRSDVDDDRNEHVLQALVPEILNRYASDHRRIYAAGFSGTAMISWSLGVATNALAGVIGVGGRHIEQLPPEKFTFAHFGFSGERDFNNREMREVDAVLDAKGKFPHRFVEFDGEHQWITPALAREAIGWMDIVAMKQGTREKDDAFIARELAADTARASELEQAGNKLAALRRYREIVRTYDGLAPIDDATAAVARFTADPEVDRLKKDEAKWDEFERDFIRSVFDRTSMIYGSLRQEGTRGATARLEREYRVAELKRHAERPGAEGRAARRLLESMHSQLSFYVATKLFERKEYSLLVPTLEVALKIHPDRWHVHYNLAAAWARLGDSRRALASMRKAVELGFKDPAAAKADPDLESLKGNAEFEALLATIP